MESRRTHRTTPKTAIPDVKTYAGGDCSTKDERLMAAGDAPTTGTKTAPEAATISGAIDFIHCLAEGAGLALGFGLFGYAALLLDGDVGHGSGVGSAVEVVLAGGDENDITLDDGQGLIFRTHTAGAGGDD